MDFMWRLPILEIQGQNIKESIIFYCLQINLVSIYNFPINWPIREKRSPEVIGKTSR